MWFLDAGRTDECNTASDQHRHASLDANEHRATDEYGDADRHHANRDADHDTSATNRHINGDRDAIPPNRDDHPYAWTAGGAATGDPLARRANRPSAGRAVAVRADATARHRRR